MSDKNLEKRRPAEYGAIKDTVDKFISDIEERKSELAIVIEEREMTIAQKKSNDLSVDAEEKNMNECKDIFRSLEILEEDIKKIDIDLIIMRRIFRFSIDHE